MHLYCLFNLFVKHLRQIRVWTK